VVDLEVLGPLVVRVGGEPVRLGPTLRILLLGLLCAQENFVPASRLAGLISETGTPQGSPATLRSHVSHLRRALGDVYSTQASGGGDPVIVTNHVGGAAAYALRVDAERVDASRFVRDVTTAICELKTGSLERAPKMLRRAISLWRGQPLADAANRAFAQAEIKRLEGTYRAAIIARIQADVTCGLHRAVIGELQALTATWPEDEAVRVLLVICLYRSGRSAEASQACRAAVQFALDHGLEPHGFSALQRDVLSRSLPDAGLPHVPMVKLLE
jgi:DNA-binding SARP family transcriptional activator